MSAPVEVMAPQALPQDEGEILHVTVFEERLLTVAVKSIVVGGVVAGTSLTLLSPALVFVTVMEAQLTEHGPLPPVAHPPASARLSRAAAKNRFFIMSILFKLFSSIRS